MRRSPPCTTRRQPPALQRRMWAAGAGGSKHNAPSPLPARRPPHAPQRSRQLELYRERRWQPPAARPRSSPPANARAQVTSRRSARWVTWDRRAVQPSPIPTHKLPGHGSCSRLSMANDAPATRHARSSALRHRRRHRHTGSHHGLRQAAESNSFASLPSREGRPARGLAEGVHRVSERLNSLTEKIRNQFVTLTKRN